MSEIIIQKDSSVHWQHWKRYITEIPGAACAFKNDIDLTLIAGNQAFFFLLDCSEEVMQLKYGGRLAALLDTDVFKTFTSMAKDTVSELVQCRQRIKRNGSDAWIETGIRAYGTEAGTIFCCTMTDVTTYEIYQRSLMSFEETIRVVAAQACVDYFEYDFDSGDAEIRSVCSVLPAGIVDESGRCTGFIERLISEKIIVPGFESILHETFKTVQSKDGKAVCEVQINGGSQRFAWVRITMARKRSKMQAVGLIEDITKEKEAANSYLNETQFYQVMLSEKDAFAQVDVTKDCITRIGGMWNLYNEIIGKVTYSALIEEFINKVVHPDDRKHYLEIMQCANFIESLSNGIDQLGCEFRRIVNQNKMVWMELNVHLFRNPLTQHVHGLLSIKNIDDKKKQEMSLLHASSGGSSSGNITGKKHAIVNEPVQHFDSFLSEQGDIAYLVDPQSFELLCGNKAFYDRLGMSKTQCTQMKCYELMQRRKTPCPFCSRANWTTDKFYLWRNLNQVLEQEFLIKNRLVNWGGREVLLAIAVDISNDKSIVDSMENGTMETHSILSGVQRMAEASALTEAMNNAMESIGNFFRADTVQMWQYKSAKDEYERTYLWTAMEKDEGSDSGHAQISSWLKGQNWRQPIMLESPEAMLGYSYDMYQYMKMHNIRNQRWMQIKDREEELGCISIDNLSSNFQNTAFLESFSVFIASEFRKRYLMENALYSRFHDDLTDLLNRKSFEEYLQNYSPDQIACIGVVLANVNNLKAINGSCGFHTGNYYLCQFADMLRQIFNNQAVFRLNGDEFMVILAEVDYGEIENQIDRLEKLIEENGAFKVSIGTAWDNVENDLTLLIDQASRSMKVNKKKPYGNVLSSADEEHRKMLKELVDCIENREFEVFLQPKVELKHGTLVGAEALIRYRHKDKGYIPPAMFIDMLEKNNLIRYIDLFVFEEVCRQLEKWKHEGTFLPVISLNFSRITLLERDILNSLESIISRYDVSRQNVEIEITESIVSMSKSVLYQTVQDIFQAGYPISLDDFGTKYTNLAILADLEFSMLKVDRSLVGMLGKKFNHELVMKNIIVMCRDLRIDVLAEGIETKEQEEVLIKLGCGIGQGYLYGKPVAMETFSNEMKIKIKR